MQVKFFPHPADIEFEVYGETLEEVFKNAAKVVFDAITPIKNVNAVISKEIEIKSEDLESLLYDFLENIIILHDSENLVFKDVEIHELKAENEFFIKASLKGEQYNPEKHESGVVIKAVTYHEMKIGKKIINGKEMWFAHVVLDI
ncbi:MAG TPA: archease [Nanoarchaeota archaeon]|nr:archease [Nanoarchaeota archaeon]